MEAFFKRILALDRRWIFLLLATVLMIPIIHPLFLPGLKASPSTRQMFNVVDSLPEGSPVLISFDFDPSSKPELAPMAEAIIRHAFKKKLKVVAMCLWVTGSGLQKDIVDRAAADAKAVYGEDFVNLGFKAGGFAVITGMGENIYNTYPTDSRGTATASLPLMERLRRLKDFSLVVSIAAGSPGIDDWVAYGSDKYKFKLAGGTTGVQAPAAFPYLQAGQMVGLISAMRGAAEYELLVERPAEGFRGMDAISLGHYLVVLLIILGNIAYVFTRGKKGARA